MELKKEPIVEQDEEVNNSKKETNAIDVSISELYNNNWHFGYKTKHRNPKMSSYIFKSYNNVDIIDLNKTAFLLKRSLNALRKCVSKGGRVLFVGTEPHTSLITKSTAERSGQYYISKRWLGGLLTNWNNTFFTSINTMKKLDKDIESGYTQNFTKREQIGFVRKRDKFLKFLEGVKDMGYLPNMVVLTSSREKNAIKECKVLNIPCVVLLDTNADPSDVSYPVPGNDRSIKTVDMFVELCGDACLLGLRDEANIKSARAQSEENHTKPVAHTKSGESHHHAKNRNYNNNHKVTENHKSTEKTEE